MGIHAIIKAEKSSDLDDGFPKAAVVGLRMKELEGDKKEHSEQGRVKSDVYIEYVRAASRTGFANFLVASVLQQAAAVLGNVVLRTWGEEHNRELGRNSDVAR